MTIWARVGVFAFYTVFIFGTAWHIHSKFDEAAQFKAVTKQVDSAHKAENNIIKFNSDLGKAHDKDACFNSPVPDSINSLLK